MGPSDDEMDRSKMSFRISGLDAAQFAPLMAMNDEELARHRARRETATGYRGCPCRVTLDDAQPGEDVIVVNFEHLAVDSPYRSSHAIFVRVNATAKFDGIDEVPPALARRLLSVRGCFAARIDRG